MRRLATSLVMVAAALGCLSGCGSQGNSATTGTRTGGNYKIVTTTAMVGDIVRNVAGDKAEVINLLQEGSDPHQYIPTRDDMNQVLQADVVFYSGLNLEARMTEVFEQAAEEGKPVYAVTAELERSYKLRYTAVGHPDPHVWMDVSGWSQCVSFVAKQLKAYDAANAAYYQDNAAKYQQDLKRLDDYAKQVVESIPEQRRMMITAHDAFSYFARAYGIEVRAPQDVDTRREASVGDINRLVDLILERKIAVVFPEDSVNENNLNAILKGVTQEAARRGWQVRKPAKKLYSDSMGAGGTYEGTYMGMIDHNATLIARELGGKAPETGLNGKLGGPRSRELGN